MKTIEEILLDYTRGEKDLPETNEALKEAGSGLTLNPSRNEITEEEKRATTVGDMEKVHVVDGRTPDVNMGEEIAYVYIAGRKYRLLGDILADPEV